MRFDRLKNNFFLYFTSISYSLIVFSAGTYFTWTSPVLVKLNNSTGNNDENPLETPITNEQSSWIGSVSLLGAIFGPIPAGFLINKIGRKNTLFFAAGLPLFMAFSTFAFAKNIIFYYLARILGGFASTVIFTALPVTLAELPDAKRRGRIGSFIIVNVLSGELLTYVIGPYLSIKYFNVILAAICAISSLPLLFLVDTPQYYLIKNNMAKAAETLAKLRNENDMILVNDELMEMKSNLENELKKDKISLITLLKTSRRLRKGLFISCSLFLFQQMSGIIIILFYINTIFVNAGTNFDSNLSTIIVGFVQLFSSLLTPLFVDRWGRKVLLLISSIGMVLSHTPLGFYFFWKENGHDVHAYNWIPLTCVIFFLITYNVGFGTIPLIIMGEIFQDDVKAAASSISMLVCSLAAFFITKVFLNLTDAFGSGITFWMFSGICFLAGLFTFFFVFETKGKTLKEIQSILNN